MSPYQPYRDSAADHLYHLLFADDAQALAGNGGAARASWARVLVAPEADPVALRALAAAPDTESRVAAAAWRRLQAEGHEVPRRQLLGVVIEVPLESGLDTLAVYRDGSVRFIHGSGHATLVEGPEPTLQPLVQRLLAASQAVVDRIGPSEHPRGAPPQRNVRLNFIVSDGLYFGEGPMNALMNDALAGPVLMAGVAILDRVTGMVAA